MIPSLKAAYPTWAFAPNVMRTARITGWSGTEYTARVEQAPPAGHPARVVYGRGTTAPAALEDALRGLV